MKASLAPAPISEYTIVPGTIPKNVVRKNIFKRIPIIAGAIFTKTNGNMGINLINNR